MAHFAEIGENNIVLRVIVVGDKDTQDTEGNEVEEIGAAFCRDILGGTWKKTSYNGNIRKNFAGVDYTYDSVRDAFIPPKPYNSWILNDDTCMWECPVAYPNDGEKYVWDEESINWKLTEE